MLVLSIVEIAKMAEELRIKMLENLERFKKLQKICKLVCIIIILFYEFNIVDPSMALSMKPVETDVSSTPLESTESLGASASNV